MVPSRARRLLPICLVLLLSAANLALALSPRAAQDSVWWKNYHWTRSNLRVLLVASSYSSNDAVRAVNSWSLTDLNLASGTPSGYDILITDGLYGEIGWRGLATVLPALLPLGSIATCQARLNRTYRDFPDTRSRSWRWQGTYCQEVGHCVGLWHDATAGCMDGSAMADGAANGPSPQNMQTINTRY